jgi:hypothetical protein
LIGFERKIGYSFLGLMAGNAVSFTGLLTMSVLARMNAPAGIREFWTEGISGTLGLSLAIWVTSMLGWVLVGLPVVLSIPTRIVGKLSWITSGLIGAALGLCAMLLFFLAVNGGKLDKALYSDPQAMRTNLTLFADAALIAGVAFAVYGVLVKRELRRQAKENGVPKGTPRTLAWFDC